jgi:hypothetical protein
MGLSPWLLRAIKRKGFRLPTPIQRRSLPLILQVRGNVPGPCMRTGGARGLALSTSHTPAWQATPLKPRMTLKALN